MGPLLMFISFSVGVVLGKCGNVGLTVALHAFSLNKLLWPCEYSLFSPILTDDLRNESDVSGIGERQLVSSTTDLLEHVATTKFLPCVV